MLATILYLSLVFTSYEHICYFEGSPEIFSREGADWSYLVGATEITFTANPMYNQIANGQYKVVLPFDYDAKLDRWYAVVDPAVPIPPDVGFICLYGILQRNYVFQDGFESGDLGGWTASE